MAPHDQENEAELQLKLTGGNLTTLCSNTRPLPATANPPLPTAPSRPRRIPDRLDPSSPSASPPRAASSGVNRCSQCRRRVGLTGFRCRCGDLFCAEHRYSDRHVCSFDYKAVGREAIARENPVVKASKLLKL